MQGNFNNSLPPQQGFNNMQQPGIQSQGYNPNSYPYNAAASAYNYYNSSEYPCNQYTNPAAFGQQGQIGLKDKIKNFFRFGKPQPQVLLGPDGHPLPSQYVDNGPGARRQKYVQDKAQVADFLGAVDFNRSRQVHHKNLHGFEYQANEGPARGNVGPAPFPQNIGHGGFNNFGGPGPLPQQAPFQQQAPFPQQGQFQQQAGGQYPAGYSQQMQMGQQGYAQGGPMYQQPGSPMRRGDFAPAPVGGVERTSHVEVKNLPNGGFEERKETFRREEHITKASKPSEEKTMTDKLQDKVSDAKEWVSDKLSGSDPKETKESKLADGFAKPEKVGEDLVQSEDRQTKEIIDEGQRPNH